MAVGGVGQQGAHCPLHGNGIVRRVVALHLIVDDAGPPKAPVLGKLQPVSLLGEHLRAQQGEEYRIAIDLHDVEQIGLHRTACRVDGLIREGHGVEEGAHAAAHEDEERILQWVTPRAAERRMLEDMRDPRGVRRRRLEDKGKEILPIIVVYVIDLATRSVVPVQATFRPVLRKRRPRGLCEPARSGEIVSAHRGSSPVTSSPGQLDTPPKLTTVSTRNVIDSSVRAKMGMVRDRVK